MFSIIIPFYNEEHNLQPLHKEITDSLIDFKDTYEIIFVDDGSSDSSKSKVESLKSKDEKVVLINHRKRFGKGEALQSGLKHAKGDFVVFMDADMQDDPRDIPHLFKKINEGYDFVNGIRAKRQDNVVVKAYSFLARLFLKLFLHSPYEDVNCGFKMFRKKVLSDIILYGNNFRFLPLAVYYKGFKVGQVPVNNRPRASGVTKYGISKLFIGIIDTLTAYFLYRFSERPLHFFGIIGGLFFAIGFIYTAYLVFERIFFNVLLYRRPALLLGILFIIVGIQIAMTGIIGELIVYLSKRNSKS